MTFINGAVPIPRPNPRRDGGDDIFETDSSGIWSEVGGIFESIWDPLVEIWRDDVAFDRRLDLLHAEAALRDEAQATAAGTPAAYAVPRAVGGIPLNATSLMIVAGVVVLGVFVVKGLK